MLTVMNEMSMASIVATAGKSNFISVLWFRCLSVQAPKPKLYTSERQFFSPNCSSCSKVCGSLLARERPTRGHVGHIEEIHDTIR